MLDLLICHDGTCENCGNNAECVRVKFWDGSFYGLLCWDEFIDMVRAKSQDPQARKKFGAMRPTRKTAGETLFECISEAISASEGEQLPAPQAEQSSVGRSDGKSETYGFGNARTEGFSHSHSEGETTHCPDCARARRQHQMKQKTKTQE